MTIDGGRLTVIVTSYFYIYGLGLLVTIDRRRRRWRRYTVRGVINIIFSGCFGLLSQHNASHGAPSPVSHQ